MKLYQSLGSDSVDYDPTELWNTDDECLSENGEAMLQFVIDNAGECSVDLGSSNDAISSIVRKIFVRSDLEHKVPTDRDWWEAFAHLLNEVENLDDNDRATVYYCLETGDELSEVTDSWSSVEFISYYDEDCCDSMEDAFKVAARNKISENICSSCFDDVENYIDFLDYGRDNFSGYEFAGGYIMKEDNC